MNIRQGFLLALILVFLTLGVLMVVPFIGYIIAAGIIAYMLQGVQQWLEQYVRGSVAAGLLVLLTIVLMILPLFITGFVIAEDVRDAARQIQEGDVQIVEQLDKRMDEWVGQDVSLQEQVSGPLRSFSGSAVEGIPHILGQLLDVGIGLSMLLFLEFYLLRDGRDFLEWTKTFDVMPTDLQEELYEQTGEMVDAVVKGSILVALIQAIIAGIGLFAVGIPNVIFWTIIMALLGLIPIIGSSGVWVPAALYLMATGELVKGVLLLIYGGTIVGLTDDILRPILVERGMRLNEVVIIIGIIGGVVVFGPIGVFIGPVMLGILAVLLDLFREHYREL